MSLRNYPEFYPQGAVFMLPEPLTWKMVAASRRRWNHDPSHAPLACGPGVVAWGRPLLSNYQIAA